MYNPGLSYEDNYRNGPFAEWCYVRAEDRPDRQVTGFPELRYVGPPLFTFLGEPVHLPLGVPAGPLLGSRYLEVAWRAGLGVCTYKTVRSRRWPSHSHPNVLAVSAATPWLTPTQPLPLVEARPVGVADIVEPLRRGALSISNSFGVPSWDPDEWQRDVARAARIQVAMAEEHPGLAHRVLVLSFQGTRPAEGAGLGQPADPFEAFVGDALLAQRLAGSTVQVLEINLSCPNERGAPLFTDVAASLRLLESLRRDRPPGVRLIVKLGSLPLQETVDFVAGAKGLVDGISAINTVSARILTPEGQRALGSGDESGGVCGRLILEANLKMMAHLVEARERAGLGPDSLTLVSVGGIHDVASFEAARAAGADHIQAATACMWGLDLAADVATALGVPFERRVVAASPLEF